MKKMLSIMFMSFYFFGNTMFMQLLKLPMVFVHYNNHLAENDKLSFFYYLTSHYDEAGDGNEFDNEEESKMPFMQNNNINLILSLVSFSTVKVESPIASYLGEKYINYNQNYHSGLYAISLLKPPTVLV